MTTGRINQVAILGHTSGSMAACSDSTLSARLRGGAPPTGLPDPIHERGGRGTGPRRGHVGHGQRLDDSRMQNGRASAGGPLCGTARSPPRGGSWARAAAQSPITWKPANTRLNGTVQAAARKHAVDMDTSGPKTQGGGRDPGGHRRPAPSRGRGSTSRGERGSGTATLPAPSSSSCMQRPGVGPGRGTEAAANAAPPSRTEHRPVKGHAPHRRGRSPSGRP